MKYIITLCLALAFSSIDAQNLQFSQVLTFTGSYSSNNQWTQVVPDGKVWKIEFAQVSSILRLNGKALLTNSNLNQNQFPIWIKAGDVLSFGNNSDDLNISIIEFTLVP